MNQPIDPFHIAGNLYYVGASDVTAFLITTAEGHIVIDGGFKETAAMIRNNVEKLGFEITDVKILLNSHSHLDHAGGLAALKEWSGAELWISEGDADQIENGGKGDFLLGDWGLFPPAKVDRRLKDGEQVRLGDTTLVAHITAGHTKGCTTWAMEVEEDGRPLQVVSVCSTTVLPDLELLDNPQYPTVAKDYANTFDTLKNLPCDIFLASHGVFFDMSKKRQALHQNPAENPFIDPQGYRKYVERAESRFQERLSKQQDARRGKKSNEVPEKP